MQNYSQQDAATDYRDENDLAIVFGTDTVGLTNFDEKELDLKNENFEGKSSCNEQNRREPKDSSKVSNEDLKVEEKQIGYQGKSQIKKDGDPENLHSRSVQNQPKNQQMDSETIENPSLSVEQIKQHEGKSLELLPKDPQVVSKFSVDLKSPDISLSEEYDTAEMTELYFKNKKLALTHPIVSQDTSITFRLDNLKYCLGVGVALKEVVAEHEYDYRSTTANQLGHGLYLITTQGYSWSHSEQQEDDVFRQGFNGLYSGVSIQVRLIGETLEFKCKKLSFSLYLPSRIREKYILCFCAYLHEKGDSISIVQP